MSRLAARIGVTVAFAVGFGWQLFGALSNLLIWLQFAASIQQQLSAFAWVVLLVGLAIPIAGFVAALVVTRRRALGSSVLVLLVALCASQALGLSQLAFFQAGTGSL